MMSRSNLQFKDIKFPSEGEIEKNFRELEETGEQNEFFLFTGGSSLLTQIKFSLCQRILCFCRKEKLEAKYLAYRLDLEEEKAIRLLNCQV